MKNLFLLGLLGLASLSSAYDESRVRSAASKYYSLGNKRVTATGYSADRIRVHNKWGGVEHNKTIGWWKANPNHPYVFQVVNHTGGQTSIRLKNSAQPWVGGGSSKVVLTRNGATVDSDPVF